MGVEVGKDGVTLVLSWLGKCVEVIERTYVGLESSRGAGGKESSEGEEITDFSISVPRVKTSN